MSTQSGALGLAILDYAKRLDIGISSFVSVGNKPDVSGNDLIQVLGRRSENVRHPALSRELRESRRSSAKSPGASAEPNRSSRSKPDDRWPDRAPRPRTPARWPRATPSSMRSSGRPASSGPNGSRSCSTSRRCSRINRSRAAGASRSSPTPAGREFSRPTPARPTGSQLPPLGEATRAELRSFLPAAASVGNPVDMLASAPPEHYRRALAAILQDDHVDSVIAIFIPPLVTEPDAVAAAIAEGARGDPREAGARRLHARRGRTGDAGAYSLLRLPRIRGAGAGARHGLWRVAREAAESRPLLEQFDRDAIRRIVERVSPRRGVGERRGGDGSCWQPPASRAPRRASRRRGRCACDAASAVGFPVALKALGPDAAAQDRAPGCLPESGR